MAVEGRITAGDVVLELAFDIGEQRRRAEAQQPAGQRPPMLVVVPFERGVAEIVDAAFDVRRNICRDVRFNPLAAVQVDDRAGSRGDDDGGVTRAVEPPQEGLLERARNEPGVQKLLYEFGAQVVEIRPLETPEDSAASEKDADRTEETR